ncbi:MAG: transposase [Clostridium perfringens]|nr:transposase [Clostridium perfringens]
MKNVKRAYKIEINPTNEQKSKIHQTIGVSRFIYNFYIARNKEIYEREGKFVSGMDFSKWLNNEYIPNNQEMKWIKEVSSKATKQAIMNGDKAFRDFFKKAKGFPKFKKKKNQDVKAYFPKNNKTDWTIERHRVKIPTLGWVRLKEFGYIPINSMVKSGTVSKKADRYYVSILVEERDIKTSNSNIGIKISNSNTGIKISNSNNEGLGIDLGIKEFTVCSDGIKFKNVNKTSTVKKVEKKLKREQRKLSRKYESLKIRNKNIREGRATSQNIQVKQKPSYITIEDLNVKGMMKNKHLSKAIASQKFFEFKNKLVFKCKQNDVELRVVDRFYPSSKTCSNCGKVNKDLKLSDRIYRCNCGLAIDRDLNASINLKNAKEYKIA